MAHATEPLTDTARFLADCIQKAFNTSAYSTPIDPNLEDKYLPEKIYASKEAEQECKTTLNLDIAPVLRHLRYLSTLYRVSTFRAKFQEFEYSRFIREMIMYVGAFEKCTSYYSTYLDAASSSASSLLSLAKRDIKFDFLFEKESQVMN